MTTNLSKVKEQCPSLTFSLEDAMNQTPGCVWIKQPILLGEGEEASVYLVCKECETGERICHFAVKHFKRATDPNTFLKNIQTEVRMHRIAESLGIAPHIHDAFICGNEGYIVMDKKDMNLIKYLQKVLDTTKNLPLALRIIDQLEPATIRMIELLHRNRYIHNDPHLENVMIDVDETNLPSWSNPQLIDFSKVTAVESEIQANKDEPINQVSMSFNKLREDIKTRYNVIQNRGFLKEAPKAPRKIRTVSNEAPAVNEPPKTPKRNLEPINDDDFFSTPKKQPLAPKPNLLDDFGEIENDDLFSTPKKQDETESKDDMFSTPKKQTESNDSDDDDASFLRRYYPYRGYIGDAEPYEELIDPDYYLEGDYNGEDEYFNELQEYD